MSFLDRVARARRDGDLAPLVAAVPYMKAMGMRMMLGLFARPAGGEDTMTSTIEVTGDGSVFANGQQLK